MGDILRAIGGVILEFIAYAIGEIIVENLVRRFGCRTLTIVGLTILLIGGVLVIFYTRGA